MQKSINLFALQIKCLVFRFCNILLKVILEQTLDQDQVLNNVVSSFETVVITSILQMMDHFEN